MGAARPGDRQRATDLRRELALLEDLAPALSLPIPAIAHVARRDGQLLLAGYRAMRGDPLTHERTRALPAAAAQHDILSSLAAFLPSAKGALLDDAALPSRHPLRPRPRRPRGGQQAVDRLREHLHNH